MLCEINDIEDLKLAKFMAGLRENIRETLMVIPNLDLQLAFNMALTVEQAYTKKKMFKNNHPKSPRSFTPKSNNPSSPRLQRKTEQPSTASGKAVVSMRKIVCFKCHGHGHYKDSCPNAKVFTAQEWKEIREDIKPKMMLVSRNGRIEEDWPPVPED